MTNEENKDGEELAKRLIKHLLSEGISYEDALAKAGDIIDKLLRIFEELKDEKKMKELKQKWEQERRERIERTIKKLKQCVDEMQKHGKLIAIDHEGDTTEEVLTQIKEYARQKGAEIIDVRGNLEETKKIVEELYYKYDSEKFANKIVILNVDDFNAIAKSISSYDSVIGLQLNFATEYRKGLREGLVIVVEKDKCWYGGYNEHFYLL